VVRDVLGRTTEAEIDHGGRTELADGTVLVERYRGTVGAAADPGPTWAHGSAHYRIEWPEATVATSARLDLRGDADAFEVRLDLEASDGDASPATSPDTWPPAPPTVDPPPRPAPGPHIPPAGPLKD
jgi:hypothetical protein